VLFETGSVSKVRRSVQSYTLNLAQ